MIFCFKDNIIACGLHLPTSLLLQKIISESCYFRHCRKANNLGDINQLLDFDILNEKITPDNVLAMSEIIAFMETRYLIGYMGGRMQKMFADLLGDIKHKNEVKHVFSDSYDLVQEGALYLCEHYGEHLNDIIGYSKKGKKITIRFDCIRKMMKLITCKWSDNYRSISTEDLTPNNEPSIERKQEIQQDYTQCTIK